MLPTIMLVLSLLASAALAAAGPAHPVVSTPDGAPLAVAELTAAGDAVWFSAVDTTSGRELWRSDGTAAGTHQVIDLVAGPTGSNPTELVAWQNGVAFVATDAGGVPHLYRSDGTAAGTQRLTDLLPGLVGSHPRALVAQGELLLFADGAYDAWQTDGSPAGTKPLQTPPPSLEFGRRPLERIDPGSRFTLLTFNVSTECCQAFQVVRADPQTYLPIAFLAVPGGIAPDPRPSEFAVVAGRVAFAGNGRIHWTDGEAAIALPADFDGFGTSATVSSLVPFGAGVAFAVGGTRDRNGLWLSDGTADGTRRIAAFHDVTAPVAVGDRLLFSARVTDEPSALWRADTGGAERLLDGVEAENLTAIGGAAVFTTRGALLASTDLWVSDATPARTGRVQRLGAAAPSQFTVAGERLFFVVDSPAAAATLWSAAASDLQPFAPPPCAGDCNGDARVTVEELIAGVALALGQEGDANCRSGFCHADCGAGPGVGRPAIACLVTAVGALLDGCPVDRCVTDTDCDDGNGCSADQCTEGSCSTACVCV
jgi:ELWxxDGT repeat protein